MKVRLTSIALGCTLFASLTAIAQKPANATGQCKDGSYWTGTTKSGACRGHQGIQTWYADSAAPAATAAKTSPAAAPAPAKPAPAATPKPSPAAPDLTPRPAPSQTAKGRPASPPTSATAPVVGGGPGLVWVNTSTKVYHCYGDRYYGKTKDGKYMTEADAKAMGARGDRGQSCSK